MYQFTNKNFQYNYICQSDFFNNEAKVEQRP